MRTRQEGSAQDADSMKLFGSDANTLCTVLLQCTFEKKM